VIQNVWGISRDPNIYSDPETSNIDRLLKMGKSTHLCLIQRTGFSVVEGGKGILFTPSPRSWVTVLVNPGRICPGRYLALRNMYLVIACVLSVFNIGPDLDDGGDPRMPKI
jgi:cytochrome P450